ncbi:MAG: hypothetical protein K2L10_07690 [Ruminococcus sp.]|nr:hypothetical protein [Ruminococcus sp.]
MRNMKQKPESYRTRDEVEEIIKENNIDRSEFHEVSKYSYLNILRKFYYTFFDYNRNVRYAEQQEINLSYAWLHFRKDLNQSDTIFLHYNDSDIDSIKSLVSEYSDNMECFCILAEGWVYEGKISAILNVIPEVFMVTDYYIISKKFDWVVVNCEDGECLYRVSLKKTFL